MLQLAAHAHASLQVVHDESFARGEEGLACATLLLPPPIQILYLSWYLQLLSVAYLSIVCESNSIDDTIES